MQHPATSLSFNYLSIGTHSFSQQNTFNKAKTPSSGDIDDAPPPSNYSPSQEDQESKEENHENLFHIIDYNVDAHSPSTSGPILNLSPRFAIRPQSPSPFSTTKITKKCGNQSHLTHLNSKPLITHLFSQNGKIRHTVKLPAGLPPSKILMNGRSLRDRMLLLYSKYLCYDSVHELNISFALKNRMNVIFEAEKIKTMETKTADCVLYNVLDEVACSILALMRDSFSRFKYVPKVQKSPVPDVNVNKPTIDDGHHLSANPRDSYSFSANMTKNMNIRISL